MIRVVVVDDEVPALNKMIKLLENTETAEIAGTFTSPADALEFLQNTGVDAVFLDIEMPNVNGIELAGRIIDLQKAIAIVFVTAYNQYAIEAFELNALDYLMKPVTAARLKNTLTRITKENVESKKLPVSSIRCFGKFTVSNGMEKVKFRTEKAEELLAFMIDHKGGFVSRSEIIDQLWTDFDGERAIIHFNTTLHYVKKALFAQGIQVLFTYDRGGYRVDLQKIDCDYIRISKFLNERKPMLQNNIQEYEEITALLQEGYLLGYDYEWAAIKRLWLEEEYYNLIIEIADYYKSRNQFKLGVKWLKQGLQKEILHRELNYKLIELSLLDHDRVLALKYYEIYRNNLKKDLNQTPDSGITRLLFNI